MDANGLRSFMLRLNAGLLPWPAGNPDTDRAMTIESCDDHLVSAAQLASRAAPLRLQEAAADGDAITLATSMVVDGADNTLQWDAAAGVLWSVSHLVGSAADIAPVALALPAAAAPVRDLALGVDDIVYLAAGTDALWLLDTRGRFEAQPAPLPAEFTPQRLCALAAAHPLGSMLLLDVGRQRLARLRGTPEYTRGISTRRMQDRRFTPTITDPDPLSVDLLPARFDPGERALGMACSPTGVIAVLCVGRAAGGASLRVVRDDGELSAPVVLGGPRTPHSAGWLTAERIALMSEARLLGPTGNVLAAHDPGAFVYDFPAARQAALRGGDAGGDAGPLQPRGEFYPLAGRVPNSGFVNAVPGVRLAYERAGTPQPRPCPLARVSLTQRLRSGWAANFAKPPIQGVRVRSGDVASADDPTIRLPVGLLDSRDRATTWHRLYLEASVPRRSCAIVWLAASDAAPPRFETAATLDVAASTIADPDAWLERHRDGWHPHLLGDATALPAELLPRLPGSMPSAAWLPQPSEVAGGRSLLGVTPVAQRTGLFTVLVQRAGHVVRSLRGRYLWTVIEFFGDGLATVELAALRVYAGRVSYRDKYLPAVYHERVYGEEADRRGRSTGADFLERYIHLFEGLLTPVEDRIGGAHLTTDPRQCPADALPWLAAWVGLALAPGVPEKRARNMLANAPQLAREHGTLAGMQRALDIATDGGVTRGRLVVVEQFRLRRTLATILGARLADFDDPLAAGVVRSANSVVGDALALGDEDAKAFLALFRDLVAGPGVDAARLAADVANARATLYDRLAFRVTVLVHELIDADELRLIRRIAEDAAPAHVELQVATARYPLLVAVAALVGADTYLRAPETPAAVTTERSSVGSRDTLQGQALLDALSGAFGEWIPPPAAPVEAPVADPGPDRSVPFAEAFTFDASASRAAPGHRVVWYRWQTEPPDGD